MRINGKRSKATAFDAAAAMWKPAAPPLSISFHRRIRASLRRELSLSVRERLGELHKIRVARTTKCITSLDDTPLHPRAVTMHLVRMRRSLISRIINMRPRDVTAEKCFARGAATSQTRDRFVRREIARRRGLALIPPLSTSVFRPPRSRASASRSPYSVARAEKTLPVFEERERPLSRPKSRRSPGSSLRVSSQ